MAMVKNPVVFQVAGYQNSGKTTFVKKLIEHFRLKNVTVATIKHHGHGGKPDILENKDSGHHISSGAIASLVEGDGRMVLQAEKSCWTLEEQVQIVSQLNPAIIMIEGHKQANFPKVVILRTIEDQKLLSITDNIKVVLYWEKEIDKISNNYPSIPFFNIRDSSGFEWVCTYITNQLNLN